MNLAAEFVKCPARRLFGLLDRSLFLFPLFRCSEKPWKTFEKEWFGEENTFHFAVGGDGAPYGKADEEMTI